MRKHTVGARRVASRLLATSAAVLTLVGFASSAMAQGSVVYSYQDVVIDGQVQWVLIPQRDKSIAGPPSRSTVLRAAKKTTNRRRAMYKATAVRVSGNSPATMKVTVNIDPSVAQYALPIMAELVYTITEQGVPAVSFPGYAKKPVTRADIPLTVFTMTRPLWQVLPLKEASRTVTVLMPDGRVLDTAEIAKRWAKKDPALVDALFSYLQRDNVVTTQLVLARCKEYGVPYAARVAPLIKHENILIRTSALGVLENVREEAVVLKAVAAQLKAEKDAKLAPKLAAFLGKSKDAKFSVLEPLFLLERGTPAQALGAIKSLGKYSKDARVVPALAKKLVEKDAKLASASADALASLKAHAAQRDALKNGKVPASLRLSIAAQLEQSATESDRIIALEYTAKNAAERPAEQAVERLAALKSEPGRKAAEAFLMDKNQARRHAASRSLAKRSSVESLPAFGKALKAFRDDSQLEQDGYTIISSLSLSKIQEQTKQRSAQIQRLAFRALGEKAQKENAGSRVFDTLKTGLKNRDPMIRGACARALGAFANAKAAEALKPLAADRSSIVRRDLALALASFKKGELHDTLVKLLGDRDASVQAAAIDALGKRKEADQWDKIKGMAGAKSADVRAAALVALSRLVSPADKKSTTEVISLLSGSVNDKSIVVRKAAIRGLGFFNNNTAVYSIASQLGASEADVRTVAVQALGNTGHAEATTSIVDKLADPNVNVRRAAVQALGKLKARSARASLQKRLKEEKDQEILDLLRKTIKQL